MKYTKKELIKIALIHCNVLTEKELKTMSSKRIITILDEFLPSWRIFPFKKRILKLEKNPRIYFGLDKQFSIGDIHKNK